MSDLTKLSINELKEELSNCRINSAKYFIIKNRIQHLQNNMINKSKPNKSFNKASEPVLSKKLMSSLQDLIDINQETNIEDYLSDDNYLSDPDSDNPFNDEKFKEEIKKDVQSKHLMERMNSEKFIRDATDLKKTSKFVSPFADDNDGVHASF